MEMNNNTEEESENEEYTTQEEHDVSSSHEEYGGNININNINTNNNVSNNEDQTDDNEEGTSSHYMEGYTPLNFNMNALASSGMLLDDDSSYSDNDDNTPNNHIMDGEFDTGYYHNLDGPPQRLNGVKDNVMALGFSAMSPDIDEDNNEVSSNNIEESGNSQHINSVSESLDIPADFQLLAEQALRGLEVEHISTLERSMDSMVNTTATTDSPPSDLMTSSNDDAKRSSTDLFEATFPSIDEDVIQDDNEQKSSSLAFPTSSTLALEQDDNSKPIILPKIQLKKPKGLQSSKPMDVNAIQKAMKSIRLKSPQLATTLDEGSSTSFSTGVAHTATDSALNTIIKSTTSAIETSSQQQQQQLASHAIIPSGPLAAFRRNTPKAQSASANLTRSATLSDAVVRLWPIITFRRKVRAMGLSGTMANPSSPQSSTTLVIHIIGADGVECSSEELVRKSVGSFVRWIDAALSSGVLSHDRSSTTAAAAQLDRIDSLLIEFSGPNMPNVLVGKELDLLPDKVNSESSNVGGLISAKAIFQQREYHEDSTGDNNTISDLVIAFNAGVWGYDSWKPTIASMISSASSGRSGIGETMFVITAYTVEECEDDAEVIAQVVEETALSKKNNTSILGRQIWGPEANQFASRLERKTASAPPGRKYFENGAWQAWLLG